MPCNALSPRMVGVIEDLAGDWRRLDDRIKGLSSEIELLARRDVGCERLMSVPGMGPIISSAMVAAIGLVTRSRKAATWVTCVELGPFATFPLRTVVQGQEPVWVRTGKPRTELRTQ
jgi:transposase